MDRGGRAGQVEDLFDLDVEGIGDIMAVEFEIGIVQEVNDVPLAPRVEIINTQDIVALFEKPLTEVRTEETGSTRNRTTFTKMHEYSFPVRIQDHGSTFAGERRSEKNAQARLLFALTPLQGGTII